MLLVCVNYVWFDFGFCLYSLLFIVCLCLFCCCLICLVYSVVLICDAFVLGF